MSDDQTPRWAMPMLHPGQAQKEMTHNEALIIADFLIAGIVEGSAGAPPVDDPAPGAGWIVAASANGDWTGQAGRIAFWSGGGWRFVDPVPGMALWDRAAAQVIRLGAAGWEAGQWRGHVIDEAGNRVTGDRQPAISNPVGGTVIDHEARAAITNLLAAARTYGMIGSAE
ncbi:DUF2793 domain-containing protein [Sphingomonas sp. BGYR3]|uniref:DUF2793 domain-containing protein n=1 Tax=Sphingomonas sp. BGYR3 TaxID=2975483 RepID=UPI0021A6BF18|nr:DUF2793 domain-containing protein [Sphingomonas sp. BGYR3]MDG5489137.1 DUF2793 domain-containing protein [Sphingomonas sp. BGYR3]